MTGRKLSLVVFTLLGVSFFFGGVAKAGLGKVDYWNASVAGGAGERVAISEKNPSSEHFRDPGHKLKIYGWGPTVGNPSNHAIISIPVN